MIRLSRPWSLVLAIALASCGGAGTEADASARGSAAASGLVTAPAEARVDLATPAFSDPLSITNPLFPITAVTQAVQLGSEGDVALRQEVTLLPETRTIAWDGREIETIVSQFVASGDGEIVEVAVDFFAQADDGSVWYFGEEVINYEDGVAANTDGSWLAGRDGPPGMIMPADPQLGDVYRPENIPGLVFEEVTVMAVDQTVHGPRGPVGGAVVVEERLMDGSVEDKVFAPGYGEFEARVASSDELVTVALAVPTDTVPGDAQDLRTIESGAIDIFDSAPTADVAATGAIFDAMTAAWDAYRADAPPGLLTEQMASALDGLDAALTDGDPAGIGPAANDVQAAAIDLSSLHATAPAADIARLDQVGRRVIIDAQADDPARVRGDLVMLQAIWDRARGKIGDEAAANRFTAALAGLLGADPGDAVAAATALIDAIGGLTGSP